MYEHILLPVALTDPDDTAEAVAKARALISENGRITLLHVVEQMPGYVEAHVPAEIHIQTQDTARARIKSLADGLGIAETVVLTGAVGRSIVHWADENKVDCIIMPSHQPTFSDLILGSSAAWVVRHAKTAVFVLR